MSNGDEGGTGGGVVGGKTVGPPGAPGNAGGGVPELTATIAPRIITLTIAGIRQRPNAVIVRPPFCGNQPADYARRKQRRKGQAGVGVAC
ncbi:MAG: hypothetical protein L0241_21310 [Planctomycetia bacterium]|nr:hypothetical protein [Planctomycetia bacterium]